MLSTELRHIADSVWAASEADVDHGRDAMKELATLLHDLARRAHAIERAAGGATVEAIPDDPKVVPLDRAFERSRP